MKKPVIEVYENEMKREKAVEELKEKGYNYFAYFMDVDGFGLSYAVVDWLKAGQTYIDKR
jgi:hypothetical protein